MNILYTSVNNRNNFLAYHHDISSSLDAPYVIFHHGLMSNMEGAKALHISEYCNKKNIHFIRFDNFGHGKSSGDFIKQTMTSWVEGLGVIINYILDYHSNQNLAENKLINIHDPKILLIGSSMGSWVSMLAALKYSRYIAGLITISAATDFTHEIIFSRMTDAQKNHLKKAGICKISSDHSTCSDSYPISYDLILDAEQHLLLTKDSIDITSPVHLIHGLKDIDVPHHITQRTADKIISEDVVIKFSKSANHNMSREQDLQIICNSINEILN